MIKTFPFRLDIEKEYNNRMYSVNSNDLKTVKFTFVVTDNGIPLNLTGLTVRIAIRKPDKKAVWQDCTVTNAPKGEVEVILESQAYIKKGEHEAELMLYKGTDTVAITQKFHYRAAEGIMSDKSLKSETVLGPIDQKLIEVEKVVKDLRENGTGIDPEARQGVEQVTAQLADIDQQKADQTYVDSKFGSLGNRFTFKGSCTYAALPTSGRDAGDYWYVTDKTTNFAYNGSSWVDIGNNLTIGNKAILPQMASFFQLNKNKFTASWEMGMITSAGVDVTATDAARTGYNPINPNEIYTVQFFGTDKVNHYAHFYDANMVHLSWIGFNTSKINTFTTPPNTAIVRFKTYQLSAGAVLIPNRTQLELGSKATDYEPSGYVLSDSYVDKTPIKNEVEKSISDKVPMLSQFVNETIKGIAHRGYSLIAPENTIPAFKLAREYGFKYVECDVQFTSDGVPVLIHDSTINRTSDGTGNVRDLTLAQLKSLDFGGWKSPVYVGTKIPTFEEFMLACKKLNIHPYIEMKSHVNDAQANLLVSTVKKLGMLRNVSWIGYFEDLDLIRVYDSKARIGGLTGAAPASLAAWTSRITEPGNVFLDMDYTYITETVSQACMDAGIPLETFTVNDPASVISLSKFNVSAIATDGLDIPKILADSV